MIPLIIIKELVLYIVDCVLCEVRIELHTGGFRRKDQYFGRY